MALYVIESMFHSLEESFVRSRSGVVGVGPGSEKIYLHVAELEEGSLAKLTARVDEDGNKQHDRLALARNTDWWIALEGEKMWPGLPRAKIASRCSYEESGSPIPKPLAEDDLAALRSVNALR